MGLESVELIEKFILEEELDFFGLELFLHKLVVEDDLMHQKHKRILIKKLTLKKIVRQFVQQWLLV